MSVIRPDGVELLGTEELDLGGRPYYAIALGDGDPGYAAVVVPMLYYVAPVSSDWVVTFPQGMRVNFHDDRYGAELAHAIWARWPIRNSPRPSIEQIP